MNTKKALLFSASLCIAYLCFTSYSIGPIAGGAGNLSGSEGSSSCSGGTCHPPSNALFTYASALGIASLYSNPSATYPVLGSYVPGTKYWVKILAGNRKPLPKFGFQASCVSGTTTKVNAGNIEAIAGSFTAVRPGTIKVIEHTKALSATSFQYVSVFEWTAPPAGTGDVTFYVVVNAVNDDGLSTGDEPSGAMTQIFKENTSSSVKIKSNIASKIYPNPCNDVLNIETASKNKLMSSVYDLAGRQVIAPSHQNNIDVSSLTAGFYLLRLNTEDGQQTATFVKQ